MDLQPEFRSQAEIRLPITLILNYMVYGWKRDKKFLYIGHSINGLARLHNHHIVNKVERCQVGDTLEIWPCHSHIEAALLEIELIKVWSPRYNRLGKIRKESEESETPEKPEITESSKEPGPDSREALKERFRRKWPELWRERFGE